LAAPEEAEGKGLLDVVIDAYGSTLLEMGNCSIDACPGLGDSLKQKLHKEKLALSPRMNGAALTEADASVRDHLRAWGQQAARHYQQKAREVKDLLLVIANTAESVSARDQRCTGQMHEVTTRLHAIASLDDLTQIRASIEKSAAELKTSIDRMAEEGKAAMEGLKKQVEDYRVKLEEAEAIASRDTLTGLNSRLYVEGQIEKRIEAGTPLCVAMVDLNAFKKVNDEYGHLVGDELLKQFGRELRSACRSTDVIGRWGGDEFILLYDCPLEEAQSQVERLRKWVCGNYDIEGKNGPMKLRVDAAIGVAGHHPGEAMKELMDRADAAMYEQKGGRKSI
jgi:diguanylate cyclase (GGDEF)-like protein